jgi:hypothetical protein
LSKLQKEDQIDLYVESVPLYMTENTRNIVFGLNPETRSELFINLSVALVEILNYYIGVGLNARS